MQLPAGTAKLFPLVELRDRGPHLVNLARMAAGPLKDERGNDELVLSCTCAVLKPWRSTVKVELTKVLALPPPVVIIPALPFVTVESVKSKTPPLTVFPVVGVEDGGFRLLGKGPGLVPSKKNCDVEPIPKKLMLSKYVARELTLPSLMMPLVTQSERRLSRPEADERMLVALT